MPWTYSWIRFLVWGVTADAFPKTDRNQKRIVYVRNVPMQKKVDRIEKVEAIKQERNKRWNAFSISVLACCWLSFLYCSYNLVAEGEGPSVVAFDPFAILEVTSSATDSEIKKAFRKQSLIYHPDKNPGDPLASARFIQVTKA